MIFVVSGEDADADAEEAEAEAEAEDIILNSIRIC